jgi:hypothetical protein
LLRGFYPNFLFIIEKRVPVAVTQDDLYAVQDALFMNDEYEAGASRPLSCSSGEGPISTSMTSLARRLCPGWATEWASGSRLLSES